MFPDATLLWAMSAGAAQAASFCLRRLSRVDGNRIAYQEPEYAEFKFIITLVEKGLQVGEDGMNCGGHNVTFTDEYRKRGAH